MANNDSARDPAWPPGTVKLSQLLGKDSEESEIVLQPRPTDNPNDPLNWRRWQKTINYSLACFYAMMVTAFINATSPTWGPLADELGFSDATLTNTYAIGCATLAIGPPMLLPFALKLGLRPVYVFSSVGQFVISIWAARTMTAGDWWGVNAIQCWLGALSNVLIQMTIAQIYFVHQRGMKNAIFVWAEQVGGYLAIVASGFITANQGWRWVWWWCTIFFGVQIIAFFFGFEESKFVHVETLDGRKGSMQTAPDLSGHALGDRKDKEESEGDSPTIDQDTEQNAERVRNASVIYINPDIPRKTYVQKLSLTTVSPGTWSEFLRHAWQPFVILVRIPGVFFVSWVYAILLAYQTVQTTSLSTIMLNPPYEFSPEQIGMMSLAPFVGSTLGLLVCGPISDRVVIMLAKRNNGIYEPEMRFWLFIPFAPFLIAGAWWFGYALENGWPWYQVAVAWGFVLFGSAPLQSLALTYILDAYNEIVGDALTGVNFVRYMLATIFVFALDPWIAGMGVGNVFNIMGAIAVVILSFAGVFIWRGKYLRATTAGAYSYYAARQYEARPIK